MSIEAVFTDLDGTLIPPNVKREEAKLTPRIEKTLQSLVSKGVKIATITTKDYRFANRILPFADAWATIGGLEIKTADGRRKIHQAVFDKQPILKRILQLAETKASNVDAVVEYKLLSDSETLAGFCFDWRFSNSKETAQETAVKLYEEAKNLGLYPILYSARPYLDVYVAEVDKGYALSTLRQLLNIRGEVIYLGDSEVDNPAFAQADISIGIIHEETPSNLEAKYKIPFHTLENLLETLLTSGEEKFLEQLVRT